MLLPLRVCSSSIVISTLIFTVLLPSAQGQMSGTGSFPTPLDCADGLLAIGVENLTAAFTPCGISASEQCCTRINGIFRFGVDSSTGGCLCNELLLEEIQREIGRVPLARVVNFTGSAILEVLQECGTSYFGGTGNASCPAPPPTEAASDRVQLGGLLGALFKKKAKTKTVPLKKKYHGFSWYIGK